MTDHYTFADNAEGLTNALCVTLIQRLYGYKTRLAVRQLTRMTRVCTVIATPPERSTREQRGCWTKEERNGKPTT